MALEEQAMEGGQEQSALNKEEEDDLRIAVLLAEKLIDAGGHEIINKAVEQSKDAGQVIGQFLMQVVSQMSEQLPEDVQLSPRIFFAHGGWVEQISDFLQDEYDVPRDVMDRAEIFIGTAAQEMAAGQQQQAPAQPAAPTVPQPGMM